MANTHSLSLNGTSQYAYITDANQTGLDITSDISIEANIRLSAYSNSSFYCIGGKYSTQDNNRSYVLYIETDGSGNGFITFVYSSDGTFTDGTLSLFQSGAILSSSDVNVWKHIAVTVDVSAKSAVLYINGSSTTFNLSGTYNDATSINNGAASFAIGAQFDASGNPLRFFPGLIDDFRVWNDLRTPTEISDNYDVELVGNEAGLVGYWKFNNTDDDETSNNNDLTLSGSPSYSTTVPFAGGTNVTVTATTLELTNSIPEFTVGTSGNVTIIPSVLTFTSSLIDPVISNVANINITASVLSITFSLNASTIYALTSVARFDYTSSIDSVTLKAECIYPTGGTNLPILVLTHGWDSDIDTITTEMRSRIANYGFFVAIPSLRGVNSATGDKDASGKEPYDVYDLVEYIKTNYATETDATNINYVGYSAGGGNGLALAVKFPDLFGMIVSYFPMSDYGYDGTDGWYFTNTAYQAGLVTRIGNTPANTPDNYKARYYLDAVKNNPNTRIRLYHDVDDAAVAVVHSQNWITQATAEGFTNSIADYTDSGDTYRWEHGYPTTGGKPNIVYSEPTWRDEMLSGTYKDASIATSDNWHICSYVKTSSFKVFLGNPASGDSLNDAAPFTYDVSKNATSYANRKTFTISNTDTANACTTSFTVYGLTPSTEYRVLCTNTTDVSVTSTGLVTSDENGTLTFDDDLAGGKAYTWDIYQETSVSITAEVLTVTASVINVTISDVISVSINIDTQTVTSSVISPTFTVEVNYAKYQQQYLQIDNVLLPLKPDGVSVWATSGRPTATIGVYGFNKTLGYTEIYNGADWVQKL